jgi:hypothetical protein
MITQALERCPLGRWVEVDRFWQYMIAAGLGFEVARNPWNLYITDANYGNLGNEGAGSEIIEGRYLLAFLFEYAATLGLVDVVYSHPAGARGDYYDLWGVDELAFLSRYDGLLAFRLTPLGAYCLGLEETYVARREEARPVLVVSPDLEVVLVREGLTASDALRLDSYGERLAPDRWRLDEAKLLAAAEQGLEVSEVAQWLEPLSIQPLPEEAERFLSDVVTRSGSLRPRGQALLVECASQELADRIARDPATKALCMRAGDRHLAIPAKSEDRFRKALRRLGYAMPE